MSRLVVLPLVVLLWVAVVVAQSDPDMTPSPIVSLSPVFMQEQMTLTPPAMIQSTQEIIATPLSAEDLRATATFLDQTFDAFFDVSTLSPATGESFTLTLNLSAPADYDVTLPDFAATWSDGFTVRRVGELRTVSSGEGTSTLYTLELEVIAWGFGQYSTPLTRIGMSNGTVDALVTVEPLFLSIPMVVGEERELRISRVVIDLFYVPVWALMGGGIFGVWGVYGIVRVARRRAAGREDRLAAKVQRTIGRRTIQALWRLRQTAPDWITRYTAMGDILRVYLTERFGVSQDLTTVEALKLLHTFDVPLVELEMLTYLLDQSDLAKFAPESVLNPTEKPLIDLAVEWVSASEKSLHSQGQG
jgi:hypothetical protein